MKKRTVVLTILFSFATLLQAQISFDNTGQQLDKGNGRQVKLGDFNCDGKLDAFVSYWNSNAVYYGDGHGLFQKGEQPFPDPIIFGDINKDGSVDVIADSAVWLNDGKGQFSKSLTISCIEADKTLWRGGIADLNGDKIPDLFAIVEYTQGNTWYTCSRVFFGDSSGELTDSGQKLGDGLIGKGQLAHVILGDFNNDGAIDAITGGWRWDGSTQCPNHLWLNDGTGHFTRSQGLDEGSSHVHGLAAGDLNGDGWLDLVMGLQDSYRSGRIYLNNGAGRLVAGSNISGQRGEGVGLADFDGDGDLDLAMAQSRPTTRIWVNDGAGRLTSGPALGNLCNWDLAVGDFNTDGKPDVFTVGHDLSGSTAIDAYPQIWLNTTPLPDPNGTVENKTSAIHFKTVQGAINYAEPGDEIVVALGLYQESLTLNKDIRLKSTDPNDPYYIGGTIIQGNIYRPVLTLSDNSVACEIAGLTLRTGLIGISGTAADATIHNCRIMDNVTDGIELSQESNPYLMHCLITANGRAGIKMLPGSGRGNPSCKPVIENCIIVDNGDAAIEGGEPVLIESIVSEE